MNRRTFIHTAGAAGLGLTGRLGLAETDGPIPLLVKRLEDSPRERLPGELVGRIRAGLRQEDLLAALVLAATRNVQPYPDVGFKYHSVMMLRSVHATQEHIPTTDRWLPLIWAADYFKDTQAQEQASSGWHMSVRAAATQTDAEVARRSLVAALDRWDHEAADVAIVDYARSARSVDIFAQLFSYGARDLREIGHKAITVANAHSLMTLFGATADAEPILRSTVAALLNSEGEPDPARHDLAPDRPWRRNRERLHQIPASWKHGHADSSAARGELRAALYRLTPEEAGNAIVEMLQHRMPPEAIWQVLFDTAAELLMNVPTIVSLHAQTTANALHYAYRTCGDEQTQQLTLLQCAAFISMFREMTHTSQTDVDLQKLEPLPLEGKADPLEEIFSDLTGSQRSRAVRKSLGYLRAGGDPGKLIATARHHLVYGAQEAHDYKFAEAAFDNYAQFPDLAWGARFLSAGMAYFKAPSRRPVPIVEETSKLLQA